MKKIVWANPNKMVINTGHKTFDRQCAVVSTGNVIAPTQYSFYIRPRTQTECNGFQFPVGHLRDTDMGQLDGVPSHVRKFVKEQTETEHVILYKFFHYARGERIVHGYVVTGYNNRLMRRFYTGPTYKSCNVIDTVIEYITD